MRKVLKNAEIVAIVNGISEMRNRESKLTEAKLPIKVNFALNKNFKRLMKEIEPYEDSRKEILRKYTL